MATAYVMPLSFCLPITATYSPEIFHDENGGEWASFVEPVFADPGKPTYGEYRHLELFHEKINSLSRLDRTLTVTGDTPEERRSDFLRKVTAFRNKRLLTPTTKE